MFGEDEGLSKDRYQAYGIIKSARNQYSTFSRRYCIFLLNALDDIGVSSVFDSLLKIENEVTV